LDKKKKRTNKNRWKVQLAATLASNPFFLNFFRGKIHKGSSKIVCVPGLNCYSCPAAAASCPIGALQAVIGSSKFQFAYYVFGILILIGVLFGRVVCGFLCPFGWFQELLHKIPTKKFSTKKLHILTYLKYMILIIFVIVLPMTIINEVGMGDPFFCKYICPAGILEGGIPLSIANDSIRASLGELFTWKSCILLGVITLAVFFYRPFCKWICPLGAFYALFNKISVYRLHVDQNKCTACGACSHVCKMDVDVFRTPNHAECIRCGDCIQTCPHQAISKTFSLKSMDERKANKYEKNN
jgi:ferredoxin-type protein NapH